MTEEMIELAYQIEELTQKYKKCFYSHHKCNEPTVYIQNNETGATVFISDSYNAELIKNHLNLRTISKK